MIGRVRRCVFVVVALLPGINGRALVVRIVFRGLQFGA